MTYADFERSKGQISLIETNIKNMFVTVKNMFVLVFVGDKFSKPFDSYLGEDDFYNFIISMVEESKYCSDVVNKKILTKNV